MHQSHGCVSTLSTSQSWSVHQSHGCQYTVHFTILVSASVTWLSVHRPLHNTGQCISHMAVSTLSTSQSVHHISRMAVSTLSTSQCWSVHQSHGCQYPVHFTIPVSASHQSHGCQYTVHFTIPVSASVTWLCQYTVHFTILVSASVTWLSVHCPLHNPGQCISHMAVSTLSTSQSWSVHQSHGCQYTAHLTILVSASVTWLSAHCPLHNTGQCFSHMAVSTLPTLQYWSVHHISHMAVSTLPTLQYWSVHQSHGCQYTAHFTILVSASVTWLCQYTAHLTILVSASVTWLSVHCPPHNTGQCISHMAVSTLPTSQYWSVLQSHGCQYTAHFTILVSASHQSHGCQYTSHFTILVSASVTWLSVHCPLHNPGQCISHMAVSVHCPLHNTGQCISHIAVVHCPLQSHGCQYTAHFTILVSASHQSHGCQYTSHFTILVSASVTWLSVHCPLHNTGHCISHIAVVHCPLHNIGQALGSRVLPLGRPAWAECPQPEVAQMLSEAQMRSPPTPTPPPTSQYWSVHCQLHNTGQYISHMALSVHCPLHNTGQCISHMALSVHFTLLVSTSATWL